MAQMSRSVVRSVLAKEQSEGAGATVRRSIGTPALRNFTPFLMLDHFKVPKGAGFPDHPHRGMTTLTYMLEGSFLHEDFVGHSGRIDAGDLQFMIAGKGISHAEMPLHGPGMKEPTGLQLWIDLPKEHKLVVPSYQELKATEVPSAHPSSDVEIKVICGESVGSASEGTIASPVRPLGGCWFLDVRLAAPGSKVFQRIPARWNAFVYTLEGQVKVGSSTSPYASTIGPFHTNVLSNENGSPGVQLQNVGTGKARLIVVAGEPLNQKVVQYGPFVMTSNEEIQQAFMDYQKGTNGFEGVQAWRSSIGGRA